MNQEKIINYFKLLKKDGLLGNSYLFIGDNISLVQDIIKLINCKETEGFCDTCWDCKAIGAFAHPDLFIIEPEPTTIKIERVRESQSFLSLKSYRAPKKTILVKNAQALGLEAANAFLKTLEEPPKHSFIAISASTQEGMLPTIISRCRKIFLPFCEHLDIKADPSAISAFLEGSRSVFSDRKDFASFLFTLALIFRDYLVSETAPANNKLLKPLDYEIILESLRSRKRYNIGQIQDILNGILEVYGVYTSINENLALNMIRMKM
ncbi:MAG: hypothetical protein PHQ96_08085 [Candidatus Omnitrophica bacterium]|nr:hypothetical protein [Candidatus Omnitrophota bacterium]